MARFWDTSGIAPLLVQEPVTTVMLALLREDEHMIVWWGSRIECISALARRERESNSDSAGTDNARVTLELLAASWSEVLPTTRVRSHTERLLGVHVLRAADAIQLASALVGTENDPQGHAFVCLDARLSEAARKEGFSVLPLDR